MNFTEQHIEVLERHKHYWESLKVAGFMRNLDKPVFDELQDVHNGALSVTHYSHWCGECVADMVRLIYVNYEKWQEANPPATVPTTQNRKEKGNKKATNDGKPDTSDSDNRP